MNPGSLGLGTLFFIGTSYGIKRIPVTMVGKPNNMKGDLSGLETTRPRVEIRGLAAVDCHDV
jgi:hypothetical protein